MQKKLRSSFLILRLIIIIILFSTFIYAACDDDYQEPNFSHTTCAELGINGCVEVWPNEQRTGYEFKSEHNVYFFEDLSNEDHYFLLMGDIECEKSCAVFQFNSGNPSVDANTVFNLNGYTMTYSAGEYETIQNNGFEEWSGNNPNSWTVESGTVEKRSTYYYMPMHGESVLYSPGAVTLISTTVNSPFNRYYRGYITIGRAAESDITIEVLDSNNNVKCQGKSNNGWLFRGQTIYCDFEADANENYKLRIKTNGYAYFDRSGIVPLNDYGIGVFTSWSLSDDNSYQNRIVQNLDGLNVPGSGDVANPQKRNNLEVMNGKILVGNENIDSVGVFLSGPTLLKLHDVKIITNGLKSHTVRAGGEIYDNYLEVNMPWYFSRENSHEENVIFGGGKFYNNYAVGGQGVLKLQGDGTQIYNNCLRNNAQATNHYAIIQNGASNPKIYDNIFDPIEGSGILTYTGHGYQIYNNIFNIKTAPCNVEYINEDYSTNGIRLNDYGKKTNYDNKIYGNTFNIVGEYHDTNWDNCMPVTTGIFYSASGDNNEIYNNKFNLIKKNSSEDAPVYALYIGGAENSPVDNKLIYNNIIETNDKAVWLGSFYGFANNFWFENNTFIKIENEYYTPSNPNAAIRIGYYNRDTNNLRMINNYYLNGFESDDIQFSASSSSANYELYKKLYLHINVKDENNNPVNNVKLIASSSTQTEVVEGSTDGNGYVKLTLTKYVESGDSRPSGTHNQISYTPHELTVEFSDSTENFGLIELNEEKTIELIKGSGSIITNNCGSIDSDSDGTVSPNELLTYIESWISGSSNLNTFFENLNKWKNEC
jgi:hypothetical protein